MSHPPAGNAPAKYHVAALWGAPPRLASAPGRRRRAAVAAAAAIAVAGWVGWGHGATPRQRAPGCDARPHGLDPRPPDAATTARLPGRPFDVAPDPSGRWAYASLPSTAGTPALAVLRRDGGRLRLARVVDLEPGLQPLGLHVTDRGRLLVAAGAALISIDTDRLVRGGELAVRRLAHGAGLIGVISTKDGRGVFATDESRAELVAVRMTEGARRVTRVQLAQAPVGLALSRDERHVYVASEFDADWRDIGVLSVVDARRALDGAVGAVLASTPAGCHPVRAIHDAARDVVWVSARESHAVLAYDASGLADRPSRALLATIPVGRAPVDMTLTDDGRSLVVADSHRFSGSATGGSLSLVDVPSALAGGDGSVSALSTGRFPRALAVTPDGAQLLVANFASRSIQSIPTSTLHAPALASHAMVGGSLVPVQEHP
jgi:DNA-binding beta-propeller fold protein YncE